MADPNMGARAPVKGQNSAGYSAPTNVPNSTPSNAQAGAAAASAAPGPQAPADGIPEATGEDARLGERLLINVTDQIFNHAADAIEQTLENADDLPITIGQIAAEVLRSQLDAMAAVGKQLSPDVYLDAGRQIIGSLYDMADAMGLIDDTMAGSVDEMVMESMNMATQYFGQIGQKYVDPQAVQQFVTDAASGKFDNMGGAQNGKAA